MFCQLVVSQFVVSRCLQAASDIPSCMYAKHTTQSVNYVLAVFSFWCSWTSQNNFLLRYLLSASFLTCGYRTDTRASEGFLQGGDTRGFLKFFPGRGKSCLICFFHSKQRKQPFLVKISKSRGDKIPLHPPSDAHEPTLKNWVWCDGSSNILLISLLLIKF